MKLNVSYSDLEQRTKELSSLLSVSEVLTSAVDLPGAIDAVVGKAVEVIPGADAGALIRRNGDGDQLMLYAIAGLDVESPAEIALISGTGDFSVLVSGPADEGTKVVARDICASLLQLPSARMVTRSAICSPLLHSGQCTGALVMMSRREAGAFSESDLRLLQAIADYLAIAIERARLAEDAEEARALREADRLKSQFISSVSHELRTPLTSIKGYSSSLLRRDAAWDDDTTTEFIRTIDEKADELRDLVDKLLQMARLEAGALKPQKEPVLMPRLAERVIQDVAARSKRHEFAVEFPETFPVVEADARLVDQVLSNLVENAAKYSPEGSKIVIRGELDEGRVIVGVSDQGGGIPAEYRDRVFERFYRVDDPLTRTTPGSGLGLSIARGHIEAHDGEMWLESTSGEGSTFYFTLPLAGAEVTERG
jgi:K+-sensing histidine kinase KdpD